MKRVRALLAFSAVISVLILTTPASHGQTATTAVGPASSTTVSPAQDEPDPTDPFLDAAQPVQGLRLRLLSQTSQVTGTRKFTVRARLEGAADFDRDQYEVAVTIYQRVRDRDALSDAMTGIRLGSPVSIDRQDLPATDRTNVATITYETTIGPCLTCVPLAADGVYPVSVDVRRRDDAEVVAGLRTNLILLANAEQPVLSVGLLFPVRGTSERNTTTDLTQLITISEALATAPELPVTVSLVPSVLDLADRDETVAGTIDVITASLANREIMSGPYEDLRPEIEGDPRLVEIVAGQRRRGEERLLGTFAERVTTATSVDLDTDALPTSGFDTLDLQRMVIAESLIESESSDTFDRPAVYDPGPSTTGPPEPSSLGEAAPPDPDQTSTAISAVVADGDLAAHLAGAPDPMLGVHHLLADLSVIAANGGSNRGVAVMLPATGLSRSSIDVLLSALSLQPQLKAVRVSDLFNLPTALRDDGSVVSVRRRIDGPETLTDDDTVRQLDRTRRYLDGVAQTFEIPPPELEVAERDFSAGLALEQTEAGERIDQAQLAADQMLAAISLGGGGPFRLTALQGRIPLSLINTSSGTAQVVAVLRSDRVVTENNGTVDIVVEGAGPEDQENGRATVKPVGVSTRSSGTFGLNVSLETPNGIALDTEQIIITSTGVSGFGVAITIGALVLLAIWWARTRRNTRRAREAMTQATE